MSQEDFHRESSAVGMVSYSISRAPASDHRGEGEASQSCLDDGKYLRRAVRLIRLNEDPSLHRGDAGPC